MMNNIGRCQGGAIDQVIITGGKMKLGVAAAQKNLDNAVLALKRARMDLATAGAQRLFHPAGQRRDPGRDPGPGAVQRRDLSAPGRAAEGRHASRSL